MSKTVPFQCQKQFHFKQFSLALALSLNVSIVKLSKPFLFKLFSQTALIQTIQFSISMQFKPKVGPYQEPLFWAIVDLRAMAMKRSPHSPKLQHHWNLTIRLFSVISKTLVVGVGVLLLCREAVGVFYSPSRLGKVNVIKPGVNSLQ